MTHKQHYVPVIHYGRVHDDVIKWKHFPRYWPFVRGIHQSSVNSPHKRQWRGALMFSFICVWTNGWVIKNRDAGDWRRNCAHYDVTVISHDRRDVYSIRNSNAHINSDFWIKYQIPISWNFVGGIHRSQKASNAESVSMSRRLHDLAS